MREYEGLLSELAQYQERVKLGGNHRYTADGRYKPGVTTVIGLLDAPALDRWKVRVQVEGTSRAAYNNRPLPNEPMDGYVSRLKRLGEEEYEHERLADEAARVGADVHALVEHRLKGMLGQETKAPEVCEDALFRFAGWDDWAKSVNLRPLAVEARLYNATYDYCGTLDALVVIENDRLVQLDWKPTPTLYDERRLQSAAYRKALVSMGWPEMEGAIVCVPRDGGPIAPVYTCKPGPELEETFESFTSLLKVYHWQAAVERRARKEKRVA